MEEAAWDSEKALHGLRSGESPCARKALRIRVATPESASLGNRKQAHGRIWQQQRERQVQEEEEAEVEEALILDGCTRRSQRIAARLAGSDEFPLRRDAHGGWRIWQQQGSAGGTKQHRASPRAAAAAGNAAVVVAVCPVRIKAGKVKQRDSSQRESTPKKDTSLGVDVPAAPRFGGPPRGSLRIPSMRRVRWWDEVDKENEQCRMPQLARKEAHGKLKSCSVAAKLRHPLKNGSGSGPLQELKRRPLSL